MYQLTGSNSMGLFRQTQLKGWTKGAALTMSHEATTGGQSEPAIVSKPPNFLHLKPRQNFDILHGRLKTFRERPENKYSSSSENKGNRRERKTSFGESH